MRARVTQSDGKVSNIVTHTFASTLLRILHRNEYIATRDCRPRIIRGENPDCVVHEVLTPDGEINPIEIEIEAPVSTQEWRLYRTVDNGPLGLVRQGVFSGPAPNPVLFVVNDLILNPTGARLCYFVQFFDEHGNGGPIKELGCFSKTPANHPPHRSSPAPARFSSMTSLMCSSAGLPRQPVSRSSPSIFPRTAPVRRKTFRPS